MGSISSCLDAARSLREEQDIFFKSVETGTDLVDEANTTELVTEEVQKKKCKRRYGHV
jgi:hypothetical protein